MAPRPVATPPGPVSPTAHTERSARVRAADTVLCAGAPTSLRSRQWQIEVQSQGPGTWTTETWNAGLRNIVTALVDTTGLTDSIKLPSLSLDSVTEALRPKGPPAQ